MEAGRDEGRAERVHLHQRRQVPGVAEVVGVFAAGERGTGRRLDGDDAHRLFLAQLLAEERERQPGEIRAAAGAADHHVGPEAGHLHLLERLDADHRLVDEHVVEHAAERIIGVGVLGGDFDRLGNGDAEAAGRVRRLGENGLAGVGFLARAGDAGGAVGFHQRAPVGLLVVAHLDHEDFDFEAEHLPGEGERRAPLPGAGLGRQLGDAGFLVVEGLRHRGVRLVAARRRDALVFVENARRRIEQTVPAGARGRAAPDATACRPRAPARGFRSRARRRPPARSAPSERSPPDRPDRSAGRCPDATAAAAAAGRSAAMLYQALGMRSSGREIFDAVGHDADSPATLTSQDAILRVPARGRQRNSAALPSPPDSPHIRAAMAKPPKKPKKDPAQADARQGVAAGCGGDARCARRSAQPGDQQGHRGPGLRHRPRIPGLIAAAG